MNINSKEFRIKYKSLFDKGYCAECVAILTSPLTFSSLCDNCQKIFNLELEVVYGKTKKSNEN